MTVGRIQRGVKFRAHFLRVDSAQSQIQASHHEALPPPPPRCPSRENSGILGPMRYRRSDQVAFRQLGDECILVPIRTNPHQEMAVFRLNEVGAFLWQELSVPATEETLSRRLAEEFEVELDRARSDLAQFVEFLSAKQLIERIESK